MKKIIINDKQLNELIDKLSILGNGDVESINPDMVTTTEPLEDTEYANPMTTDDKEKSMDTSPYQRMNKAYYSGPMV